MPLRLTAGSIVAGDDYSGSNSKAGHFPQAHAYSGVSSVTPDAPRRDGTRQEQGAICIAVKRGKR
jgi:hypothetical protein